MRPLPVFVTVLFTAALAYYIYIPLPDAIQEPWRLMMLDAALRTTMSLVSSRRWETGVILQVLNGRARFCLYLNNSCIR